MKQIFDAIDTDCSNSLTLTEVILFLTSITDDLSEKNIEKIFNGIDSSGDKIIDFMEFKVNISKWICIYQNFLDYDEEIYWSRLEASRDKG